MAAFFYQTCSTPSSLLHRAHLVTSCAGCISFLARCVLATVAHLRTHLIAPAAFLVSDFAGGVSATITYISYIHRVLDYLYIILTQLVYLIDTSGNCSVW